MPPTSNPRSRSVSGRSALGRRLGLAAFLALAAISAEAVPRDLLSATEAPLPETPAAVLEVVEIHPFRLRDGYRHNWMASQPFVSSGLLVVLRVDPAYVARRDSAEPVLYAGDRTVQRLNHGDRSGYVIGIVPSDVPPTLFWFGSPDLPLRVTAESLAAERARAEEAGIEPFSAEQIERALRGAVEAENLTALLRGLAADLVLQYSPDEKKLAETWRLPSAGSR